MRFSVSILIVLAALIVAASSSATAPAWWGHLNGDGKVVCDRGHQHQFGPFSSKQKCEQFADEYNDGGDGNGGGDPPTTTVPPQIDRMGACQLNGQYVDLTNEQFFAGIFVDANGVTQPVVPANWIQGVGETCSNPITLGYKAAGYKVDDGGAVYTIDTTFNVYPYFTK